MLTRYRNTKRTTLAQIPRRTGDVLRLLLVGMLFSGLLACSGNEELELPPGANSSEYELYQEAQRYLRNKNFELGVQALQLLESRFPFGRYAEQAQLELIYAHYNNYEPEAAIEAADRFIRLHPQHPNVDYAYYMKGLSAYHKDEAVFSRFVPQDDTKRDTSYAREAFAEFAQLLARYPDSPYATDARARMIYLRNLLARSEINIANYYFRRGAYVAAVNRGRYVVENFPQTPAVGDGLAVMVQGYQLLGLNDLAQDSLDVLVLNYPSHPAIDENGQFISSYSADGEDRSWTNLLTFGIVDKPEAPRFDNRPEDVSY